MRILFFSVAYDDAECVDQRVSQMRDQGHEVEVEWIRVPRSRADQLWLSRILEMAPAYRRALISVVSRSRFDMIVTPTSPPLIFVPAVVRGKVAGEDVTILHYDIFPKNARIAGLSGPNSVFNVLAVICAKLARLARYHETLSPAMMSTLRDMLGTDVNATVVPLPLSRSLARVPAERNSWLEEKGLSDKFVVMYAGNFGRMYDFDPMMKAAKDLKYDKEVAFVFAGAGFHENAICNEKLANGLDNVHIFSPEPEETVSQMLCAANLHIVPLLTGADQVMWPHKLDSLVALKLQVFAVGFNPGIAGVKVVRGDDLGEMIVQSKVSNTTGRSTQ
ncbi:MAG: glycosyltransferase family 4 protein [Proteobacteria bacterium]|nr:glycosyltransferase family 4 protein [Pseudomonadota bacterium]